MQDTPDCDAEHAKILKTKCLQGTRTMRKWYVVEVVVSFLAGIVITTFLLNSRIQELHSGSYASRSSPPRQDPVTHIAKPDGRQKSLSYQDDNVKIHDDREEAHKSGPPAGVESLPGRVFYLWCSQGEGSRLFEFQHYMSIISVVTFINPDVIEFYADVLPKPDDQFYNTWFDELKTRYPFLVTKTVGSSVCASNSTRKEFITSQLSRLAGLYVEEHTIFTPEIKHLQRVTYMNALNVNMEGFVVANAPIPQNVALEYSFEVFNKNCHIHPGIESTGSKVCFVRKATMYPKDAWGRNDVFSRLVRLLFHGAENIQTIQPNHQRPPIPNIAHMIWLGPKKLDFLFYLSALSLLYVVKVDTLYLHTGDYPHGEFWDRVVSEPKVVVITLWPEHDTIYENKLKTYVHQSDMLRAKILYKYGGIYADVDALFANPIPDFLRYYDMVGCYDWPWYYANWPDYINNGVMMARPNASYLMHYLSGFRDYKNFMFGYNGLLRPYKTFERYPHLIMLYDRLQVICWQNRCHPTWVPNFRSPDMDHLVGPPLNWTDAVVFHFTSPTPEELQSEAGLLLGTGIWAELGRHILGQAGKL